MLTKCDLTLYEGMCPCSFDVVVLAPGYERDKRQAVIFDWFFDMIKSSTVHEF